MFTTTLTAAQSCSAGPSQSISRIVSQSLGQRKDRRFFLPMMAIMALCFAVSMSAPLHAQNIINTVAGGGVPPGTATAANIPSPSAVAADGNGNVFISPPNSYYIFKVTSSGSMSVYAGLGYFGGGGDNNPATKATLGGVMALALNAKGDLYLADKGANRIRCILAVANGCGGSTEAVGDIVTVVDSTGQNCFPTTAACGDGGPAINAHISYATALFVDGANNLWISDTYDYRIRCVIGTAGGCFGSSLPVGDIVNIAGTGIVCDGPQLDCGNAGPALQAKFDLAGGLAVDTAGNVYVSDTRDFTVRKIDVQAPHNINIFAGNGNFCQNPLSGCGDGGLAVNAHLWNPSGISFSGDGDLYIADSADNRIRCVAAAAKGCGGPRLIAGDITTVAGTGTQGFAGDAGAAKSAFLNLPNSVFVDGNGRILIADTGNQRIRAVVSANINTIAGGGSNGDGGPATVATLANPNSVVWDTAGNFYIADADNNQVRKVTPAGVISTFAGTGIAGPPNTTTVLAVNATLNGPLGLGIDSQNNIYIADTGNQVIRGVVASTGEIFTVAGDGDSCVPSSGKCGDGGQATNAQLTFPSSVALDSNGNIYIADYYAHKIRMVSGSTGIISTLAGTGVRGYAGDGGPANKAKLGRAYGVAVDAFANVYITDTDNNRVRCVIQASGGCGGSQNAIGDIVLFAFNGQAKFKGDGGPALTASMWKPLEVAVDSGNNVFISGGTDELVRRIDASSLTIETVAGDPAHPQRGGFGGDGGPATKASLSNAGVAIDPNGNLLIADSGNDRVREVTLAAIATLSNKTLTFPATTVGQSSAPLGNTLTNTGFEDLQLSGEQMTGFNAQDFSISSNGCNAQQLAPGANCVIKIVFTPSKVGKRTARLLYNDDLGQQTLSLVGTGQ
jgi:WD40 repeat protein